MSDKKKGSSVYLKAGAWAMLAEILVRAVSFLTTPIFTRILPIDVYGQVKTFEAWLSILAPILSLGLFTNIEIAQYDLKEKFKKYISSIMCLILVVHGGVFCVAMLLQSWLCKILEFTPSMLVVAVLYSCFYSCILVQMRSARIQLKYKSVAALSLLASVPSLIISIVFCMLYNNLDSTGLLNVRVLSFYVPIILLGLVIVISVFLKQKCLINLEYWKYGIKVSLPLIMYQISLQILTQSDRIMIQQMVSPEKAAIFSIGTTVIYIVEILHKGFESAWIPWLYKKLDDKKYNETNRAMLMVLAVFGAIFFGILIIGKEIILVFGGEKYMEGIWLLGPMLGGVMFQFLMLKLADIEKANHYGGYVGTVCVIIAVVNLALNYVGILYGGYMAAAYTTMISYALAVVAHIIVIKKKLPEIRIPAFRLIGLCSLIAGLMIASMFSYNLNFIVRIVIAAVYFMFFVVAAIVVWKKYGTNWRKKNAK